MKIMTKKINFKITIEETAERHPVPVLGTDYKVKIIYKNIKFAELDVEDKIITIGYGSNEDDFKRLQEEVSKKINAKKIYITRGGSCICSHTGPEILAISSSY